MRLIDADKLEYFMCDLYKCDHAYDVNCQTCDYAVIHKHNIDNAPTVDAVVNTIEVRPKGEWIHCLGCGVGRAVCSECRQVGEIKNYCGECGAEMKVINNEKSRN